MLCATDGDRSRDSGGGECAKAKAGRVGVWGVQWVGF